MKKKIFILGALMITTLTFAGTKEDYEAAKKTYETNKDISAIETSMKKISTTKKQDKYTRLAKLELVGIYSAQNKTADAKKLALELYNDKNTDKETKQQALEYLFVLSTGTEKTKYIDALAKDYNDDYYKSTQIAYYLNLNNLTQAKNLYKKYVNSTNKINYDATLIEDFIKARELEFAEDMAKTILTKEKIAGNYYLALIRYNQGKLDEAISYAKEASKEAKGESYDVEAILRNLYLAKNDVKNALDQTIKMKKLSPSVDRYIEVISLAEIAKNDEEVKNTTNELKSLLNDADKKLLNYTVGASLLTLGADELAEKYAKKAIEEDKVELANEILLVTSLNKGNKELAKTYLEALKKIGIVDLKDYEKAINELK